MQYFRLGVLLAVIHLKWPITSIRTHRESRGHSNTYDYHVPEITVVRGQINAAYSAIGVRLWHGIRDDYIEVGTAGMESRFLRCNESWVSVDWAVLTFDTVHADALTELTVPGTELTFRHQSQFDGRNFVAARIDVRTHIEAGYIVAGHVRWIRCGESLL